MRYIFYAVAITVAFATIAVAFAIWIITIKWAIMDKKRQKTNVEAANYRKGYGWFDIMKYAQGNVMATVPSRQNNNGPNPKTYDKIIPYVNHFDALNCLILEKRDTK